MTPRPATTLTELAAFARALGASPMPTDSHKSTVGKDMSKQGWGTFLVVDEMEQILGAAREESWR